MWVRNCPPIPPWCPCVVLIGLLWNWSCFGNAGNMLNIPTQSFPSPSSQQRVSPSGQSGRNKVTAEQRHDWQKQSDDSLYIIYMNCDQVGNWVTSHPFPTAPESSGDGSAGCRCFPPLLEWSVWLTCSVNVTSQCNHRRKMLQKCCLITTVKLWGSTQSLFSGKKLRHRHITCQ